SRGYACPKGVSFHEVTHDPDRILHPMKREGGQWTRVTWDQAVREIAEKLNRIRLRHGPHAIALYRGNPSAFSYNHALFLTGFGEAIGTRNVYGAGSADSLADFAASKFLYGASFLQPIPDVERTRYAIFIGVNPAISHATLVNIQDTKTRLKAIRKRGGKVVVIDPRRTETAEIADEHVFIRPNTDAYLLLAMIRTIFEEKLEATEFLKAHAREAEVLRGAAQPFTPELAAEKTGIPAETIRRITREYREAEGAFLYGRVTCGRFGTLAAWCLEAVNVVAGKLDAPGGMLFGEGITDIAAIADLSGIGDYGRYRSRIGGHPDVLGELPAGVLVEEIKTPGEGQIRAMVTSAGNPVLSIAQGEELAEALDELECLVAVDFYMSETAAKAHYILPCTTFFERADFPLAHANLMSQPYAQWTEAVIPPQGEAKEEWEIYTLLSEAMGLPILGSKVADGLRKALGAVGAKFSPRTLMDAMIRLGPYGDKYLPWRKGLTLEKLKEHPHGKLLRPLRAGIAGEKLRTKDKKIALWNEAIAGEVARLAAEGDLTPDAAYPFR
ncbi:MAG: molybdopterin-dependent oxidoreductase, partial [Candidatus Methylomirabilis sp.]|nr:molybdopterin-dependent oxidoreductase [Deltaproteobacteria bacterium]